MRRASILPLLVAAGCQLPSVAERYAGDVARYEETGSLVDPPAENELTLELAGADDRVIAMRREAVYDPPRPRIDPYAAAPADLEVWRTSAVVPASTELLRRLMDASLDRVDRLRAELESRGADPDRVFDEVAPGTVGLRAAARLDVLRLRGALTTEEKKVAILGAELGARGE